MVCENNEEIVSSSISAEMREHEELQFSSFLSLLYLWNRLLWEQKLNFFKSATSRILSFPPFRTSNPAEKEKITLSNKSPQARSLKLPQSSCFCCCAPALPSIALCGGTSISSHPVIRQLALREQIPASAGREQVTSTSSVQFLSLFLIAVTCAEALCVKACIA